MKKIKYTISFAFLLFSIFGQAQTTKEEFLTDINHASGIYQIYNYISTSATPAPKEHEPFYISPHGRYGDLTQLGVREHRGIAERMFRSFPGLFENIYVRPLLS